MKASDVMTTGIVSVGPEMKVSEVARTMLERQISGVPVIDSAGRLAGIVTEGDLMRRGATRLMGLGVSLALLASSALAQEPSPERGRAFAEENCSRCHAVGTMGASPLPPAPPFRQLHALYPVEHLAEALAEGIVTGHPEMPEFQLTPEEAEDLIAYLRTLE